MEYHFISIGGSGAKVLESFIHLCIAGAMPDRGKLNVLAIDPDTGNGNLKRTGIALKNYEVFQNLEVGNDTPLFKTKISVNDEWNPTEQDKTLDDLMGYQTCAGTPLGALYEVLFTRRERLTTLNEGFRGHPSIGAAVLAKKFDDGSKLTAQIGKIDNKVDSVKIFLAGSVFGGTGAAGLPTIARLLRDSFDKKVSIGGALILPYFSFTAPDDDNKLFARSENFLTNTKAALKYYSQRDNVFDAMYFVGDSLITPVKEFSVGSETQRNDAHIVDLYGALAAIDFFSQPVEEKPKFKYICHSKSNRFEWNDFPAMQETTDNGLQEIRFQERFVKFTRFIFAYVHLIKPVIRELAAGRLRAYQYPWYVDFLKNVDLNASAVKNFEDYTESFVTWLRQLETVQGRDIALIKYSMFLDNPARLTVPDDFKSCDGRETDLSFHELWYRLSEPLNIDSSVNGFGKFLRRLYEACDVQTKM